MDKLLFIDEYSEKKNRSNLSYHFFIYFQHFTVLIFFFFLLSNFYSINIHPSLLCFLLQSLQKYGFTFLWFRFIIVYFPFTFTFLIVKYSYNSTSFNNYSYTLFSLVITSEDLIY